jgi:hypothetical protein
MSFNQKVVTKLETGMKKEKVVRMFQHESVWHGDQEIKNPWLIEARTDANGRTVEVYYYLTKRRANFTAYRKSLATLVVFTDNVLTAWGANVD